MNKLKKSTKEQYLSTKIQYNYLEKLKRQALKLLSLRVCAYDAGGDTSRGGAGGIELGSYSSGKAGRGFGGGGAGSHGTDAPSGAGADGAVLIRLWKE